MVNAFSDYARSPDMEISSTNVATLMREIIDLYKEQETNISITFSIDSEDLMFDVDPGRIRQIMHNLIRNSIEAISEADNGKINIAAKQVNIDEITMIEIRVEDSGCGFDKESLGQIFDPYVTSKSKGTGLGLAIVKKLVEEHMGTIEAENNEDKGAAIIFDLQEIFKSWEAILMNAESPEIKCRDARVHVYGDVASVICFEELPTGTLVTTNIFHREENVWKMIHHQAGPTSASPSEDVGDEIAHRLH